MSELDANPQAKPEECPKFKYFVTVEGVCEAKSSRSAIENMTYRMYDMDVSKVEASLVDDE